MHRNMKSEANQLVLWATDTYKDLHAQYPAVSDQDIFKMVLDKRGRFADGEKGRDIIIDRYGSSIYGICYFLGLNSQLMKGTMVSRCIQFTEYIDIGLENNGFAKPSNDIKRGYFKFLKLPESAVDDKHL